MKKKEKKINKHDSCQYIQECYPLTDWLKWLTRISICSLGGTLGTVTCIVEWKVTKPQDPAEHKCWKWMQPIQKCECLVPEIEQPQMPRSALTKNENNKYLSTQGTRHFIHTHNGWVFFCCSFSHLILARLQLLQPKQCCLVPASICDVLCLAVRMWMRYTQMMQQMVWSLGCHHARLEAKP